MGFPCITAPSGFFSSDADAPQKGQVKDASTTGTNGAGLAFMPRVLPCLSRRREWRILARMSNPTPAQPWRALVVMTVAEFTALTASAARINDFNIGVFVLVTNGGVFERLFVKAQQGSTPSVFQQIFAAEDIALQPDEVLVTDPSGNVISVPYGEVLDSMQSDGAMAVQYQQVAQRTAVVSGTVAQITGGTGVFAAPVTGQMAWCTNLTAGGSAPCWYNGAAWVLADQTPVA